jgi:hypothetical protein
MLQGRPACRFVHRAPVTCAVRPSDCNIRDMYAACTYLRLPSHRPLAPLGPAKAPRSVQARASAPPAVWTPSGPMAEAPAPREMKKICVFCGASSGSQPAYMAAAKALGECLVEQKIGLVYGGEELMGRRARGARQRRGVATGVRGAACARVVRTRHPRHDLHMVKPHGTLLAA